MIKIHKRPKLKLGLDTCVFFSDKYVCGWLSRANGIYYAASFRDIEIADGWHSKSERLEDNYIFKTNDPFVIEEIPKIEAIKKGYLFTSTYNDIDIFKNKLTGEILLKRKITYEGLATGLFGVNNWDLDPIAKCQDHIHIQRTDEKSALEMLVREYKQ